MASPLAQALAFQQAAGNVPQTPVAPTNVNQAYQLQSDVAEKNYQAQIAQNNALWGGLAGLGGAGLIGFGPTIAKSIAGASAPVVAAAPSVGTAIATPEALAAGSAPEAVTGGLSGADLLALLAAV